MEPQKGTNREGTGDEAPKNQRAQNPELFTQTRKIHRHHHHHHHQWAVLSSTIIFPVLLLGKCYWQSRRPSRVFSPCFWTTTTSTRCRRGTGWKQGRGTRPVRPSIKLKKRRGRKERLMTELFWSDTSPFRFGVSFAQRLGLVQAWQILRCTEIYYFLKTTPHPSHLYAPTHTLKQPTGKWKNTDRRTRLRKVGEI